MQEKRRWIVRVRSEETLLYAPQDALFEEFGGGYNGFERWRKDAYREVTLEQLLAVQRDLRLWLRWPDGKMAFADLVELPDGPAHLAETPSDPFQLWEAAKRDECELWEYLPFRQESICRSVDEDAVEAWSARWQERLFG
ncbi:MAG: hypothetical protein H6728_07835 [Myxococcales bacterium]|nr:hypothetical protein [Myxococcales bacterium]